MLAAVVSRITCYDCRAELPADARADICERCIRAERDAYEAKQECARYMPERMGECVCSQHVVR